jgi:hypothetical protein
MRTFLRYWNDTGYWRWLWDETSDGTKAGLALLLALLVGFGGYISASAVTATDPVTPTKTVTTTVTLPVRTVTVPRPK